MYNMIRPLFISACIFAISCLLFITRCDKRQKIAVYEYPSLKDYKIESTTDVKVESSIKDDLHLHIKRAIKDPRMKYILIWTDPYHDPLVYLLSGQETFINRKCNVKSCFISRDKYYLQDITDFDVILFNGPEFVSFTTPTYSMPMKRDPSQNYVFASTESSDYYPACNSKFDNYFNISWTYKLNSDIFFGYVIIRNNLGEIIGPQKEMHWLSIDEMKPINDTIKKKLKSKRMLAAWLVSNCNAPSRRGNFVSRVQYELEKLGTVWEVDVYGYCGEYYYPGKSIQQHLQMFEKYYYFYFSFENSFAEDYVTEKVLHPLQHYMVPVVFGTANYTRFMAEGIYINAKELGPKKLAERMVEIVSDKELYYNYFKWINHYSFHYLMEVPETDFFCKFCEAMNDESLMNRTTVIENFKDWWNTPRNT